MKNKLTSRTWIEIDLKTISYNLGQIQKSVKPAEVMVVLKANAYGMGTAPIATYLHAKGVKRIGLAEARESVSLVQNPQLKNLNCQILGALLPNEIPIAVSNNLICPIGSYETAKLLSHEAAKQKRQLRVQFKIDTGMGRLGIPVLNAKTVITKCLKLPNLIFEGCYSHLANANNPKHPHTIKQIALFEELCQYPPVNRMYYKHIANSDGINNFPDSYGRGENMVRTGINLYGVFDLLGHKKYRLKPALSLKSKLIAVRRLPKGHNIGYGCTYFLKRETVVGTIPVGYADGVPMAASNHPNAHVLIRGKKCPIMGRVSMDYITVDLSNLRTPKVGEVVVLFGKSGKLQVTVEDWARIKQSHPYDIICSLGPRVDRVYIGNKNKG